MDSPARKRICLTGLVQGIGFRPFVWKLARDFHLAGWVRNDSKGVIIEIQGSQAAIQGFIDSLPSRAPVLARIDSMQITDVSAADGVEFIIVESATDARQSTPVSPDIGTCDDCFKELFDTGDRRYGYPFLNCTNCGPRFTITEELPYDRRRTVMKSFEMCADCQKEYDDPADRRFHAQPNACHRCGPKVWFVTQTEADEHFHYPGAETCNSAEALKRFAEAIAAGAIVALKGIGGFHLACDARSDTAIALLRERKGRVDKPLAIMVRDVKQCQELAHLSESESRFLTSSARPIVLLNKKGGSPLSKLVAPGNNFIGVMLPYSPLHHLLLADGPPLVMTSGNVSDEPIVRGNVEAKHRLQHLADAFLLHDREICVVCDDSLVRCVEDKLLPIRRSRGYAPMPLLLDAPGPSVLAVGGELKATFCATKNDYAYVSAHVGDMGNLETLDAMRRSVEHFLRMFRIQPEVVAADLHPSYLSTQWAHEFAEKRGVRLLQVQHHQAHIAALMTEHRLPLATPIIGCCFDGTGFGRDGSMWGGEFFVTAHPDASTDPFERFAHLQASLLPGGDSSIRRPYRVALAQLFSAGLEWGERLPCTTYCNANEKRILRQQLERNFNCVPTSSMGRLFDAVAALIGIRQTVSYEAQAAMEMEALAADYLEQSLRNSLECAARAYRFQIGECAPLQINAGELLSQICLELQAGVAKQVIAARFHHAVAHMIVDVCRAAQKTRGIVLVGLSGGVFQNGLLLKLTTAKLRDAGFQVLSHRQVPPNDAGISLGQAVIARRSIRYLMQTQISELVLQPPKASWFY